MNSRKIDYVVVAMSIKPQDMGFFKVNDLPLTLLFFKDNGAALVCAFYGEKLQGQSSCENFT